MKESETWSYLSGSKGKKRYEGFGSGLHPPTYTQATNTLLARMKAHLTDNVDRVVDIFRSMDANSDGTLQKGEVAEGVHLLGVECELVGRTTIAIVAAP